MIRAEMKVIASESRVEEILRTLKWLMGQLEAEPGLVEADLYRSLDGDEVVLIQRWRTREDLFQYLRSDELLRLLEVMDLSTRSPQLHFETVSERQGLELVEAVRHDKSENR